MSSSSVTTLIVYAGDISPLFIIAYIERQFILSSAIIVVSLEALLDVCSDILPYWSYFTVITTGTIKLYLSPELSVFSGGFTSVNVYFHICDCGATPKSKYNLPSESVSLFASVVNVVSSPIFAPVLSICCFVTVNSAFFNKAFVSLSCFIKVNSFFVSFLNVIVILPCSSSTSIVALVVVA